MGVSTKENMFARILDTGGKLKVQSALNPLLWLCALMTTSMLFAAKLIPDFALVFIVALMLAYALAGLCFLFFMFTSPDRLQSEEYQIRKRSMEIMQQKGDPKPVIASDFEVTENPELPKVQGKFKGISDA